MCQHHSLPSSASIYSLRLNARWTPWIDLSEAIAEYEREKLIGAAR